MRSEGWRERAVDLVRQRRVEGRRLELGAECDLEQPRPKLVDPLTSEGNGLGEDRTRAMSVG